MAFWYSLWSLGIFFPVWYVWTKKNLAALIGKLILKVGNFPVAEFGSPPVMIKIKFEVSNGSTPILLSFA
jgi:hypothetical protein